MAHILILGGVSFNIMIYLDAFPRAEPQTIWAKRFHETIGSTGAGKALNLRRLGMDVTLHELIGDDRYGRTIVEEMAAAGIGFLYDIVPNGTQRHVNLMDEDGRRISIFIVPGPIDPDFDIARIEALIAASDYVALNISDYCRKLIPAIKTHGKAIWCDIHDYDGASDYHRDFIAAADYLFLSSDAMPDYRPFLRDMIARGKRLVVCTHGRHGSTALTPSGEWIETPIAPGYPRRDSNGAGDAFFAGFLYGHSRGLSVERCLRIGTIVSGLCVTSSELAYEELSAALVEQEYRRVYGESLAVN